MTDLLVHNIGELVTCRSPGGFRRDESGLNDLEVLRDVAVAVEGERIVAIGPTVEMEHHYSRATLRLDAQGKLLTPGLVDCHSHLLHGGSRHEEYETLITGQRDPDKSLKSGIQYTVSESRKAGSADLLGRANEDLDTMLEHGTTTLEVKTGYGLSREHEERFLTLQSALEHEITIVRTFLGAHVLPEEYRNDRAAYVDLVIELLPFAREHAEFCDVCCDPAGFTYDECRAIGEAALARGMKLKVHADQTGQARGTELAVELGAVSVDHLDYISDEAIAMLAGSECVGVLLPAVSFHMLDLVPVSEEGRWVGARKPFMPALARELIKAGAILAISCDYNPGTAPTLSLQMAMQLAARLYRLSYAEVWHMATINAAKALSLEEHVGSIEVGKQADLVLWNVNSHGLVINRFGTNNVDTVVKSGRVVVTSGQKNGRREPAP